MSWSLSSAEVTKVLKAKLVCGSETIFQSYGTDTREDLSSQLFIPLKGDNFDAHDYLEKAVEQGASGVLVHIDLDKSRLDSLKEINSDIIVLRVEDSLSALQELATDWRRRNNFKVIGITGTNGKTTTKEFVAQILSSAKKVYASKGSLNNHWGVPFTLLNASSDTEWVVCEMGMNHEGEIAKLCAIAEPDLVGVSFVGRGHLEGMGSVEKVALEKSQIYASSPNAKKIFNLDNFYTEMMKKDYFEENDLCFGNHGDSDIKIKCSSSNFEKMTIEGEVLGIEFIANLPIYGEHNVTNLMMAVAFCSQAGMETEKIIKQLPNVQMAWGRNQVETIKGITVVFDGYNANPESMDAFLSNASKQKLDGEKHLVLGEMMELGDEAEQLHKDLGQRVRSLGFSNSHYFGSSFKHFKEGLGDLENGNKLVITDTYEESLALKIKSMLKPNDAVFIKASRGVHLERFLDLLRLDS